MIERLRFFRAVLMIGALLVPSGAAFAQTGTVTGRVVDADGRAIAGATVRVEGTTLGTLTDAMGGFTLMDVPTGSQTVVAEMLGMRTARQTVSISSGGTATVNFTLQIDPLKMEGLVVTGTATPIEKLESSVAVTTLTDVEIEEQSPQSSAELLEVVPGFYVEASGGQGGNNVWARGIPQDGSFRYVAVYEDGLPVYESPELAFTNIDLLYRMDESVRTVEAVRGGGAAVFASNAPGGLVNILSKTGGDELAGVVKLTGGDYNLFRADVNVGGPLFGEDWRFNVGGFYRFDTGVRDPGFPANRGGQIKANITRLFENGYIRVYGKFLNERNIFYLPIPLQDPDNPDEIPGFDPNYGTLTTLDAAFVKFPTPEREVRTLDLKDGMHPVISSIGAEALFELGDGWTIKNAARSMRADVSFNAIFSLFNPIVGTTYGQDRVDLVNAALSADGQLPVASGFRYRFASSGEVISSSELANLNGNGLVVESGWWNVEKPLRNFTNDLRVSKAWEANTFTAGFYFSEYSADEAWIFNNVLQEVRDEPRLLDLEIVNAAGNVVANATQNGFTQFGNFYRNASNSGTVFALYAQDEWQATERLRLDLGGRFEVGMFDGSVEVLGSFDLAEMGLLDVTSPGDAADDSLSLSSTTYGSGQFRPYDHTFEEWAGSVGANYEISENLNVYGRFTRGFRMPDFEQWADGNVDTKGDAEEVLQAEGGVKVATESIGIFATVFWSTLTDVPFSDEVLVGGDLITLRRFADTRTIGVETEVVYLPPVPGLRFDLIGTFQQPEYDDMRFEVADPGQFDDFDFSGNQIRRIPEIIFNGQGEYQFTEVRGTPKFWVDFWFISDRFVDDANNVELPGYTKFGAGFAYDVSEQVRFQVVGDNLFNTIGLTEGNPRTGQVVGAEQDIYMARPILGRNVRASVAYRF